MEEYEIEEESYESVFPEPTRGEYDTEEEHRAAQQEWQRDKAEHEAPDEWDGQSKPFEKQFEDYGSYIEAVTDYTAGKKLAQHFGNVRPGEVPQEDIPYDDSEFLKRDEAQMMVEHYEGEARKAEATGDDKKAQYNKQMAESWRKDLANIGPTEQQNAMKEKALAAMAQGVEALFTEPVNSPLWKSKAVIGDILPAVKRYNFATPGLELVFQKTKDIWGEPLPPLPGNFGKIVCPNQEAKNELLNKILRGNNPYRTAEAMGLDLSDVVVEEEPEPPKKEPKPQPERHSPLDISYGPKFGG